MKHLKSILILAVTLAILYFPFSNILKSALLLVFWYISFRPLTRAEYVLFVITNIIFTFNDAMALRNGVFVFREPEFFLMPYWEIFMWGFYFILIKRWLDLKPAKMDWKVIPIAIFFSLSFSISSSPLLVFPISFSCILLLLFFFHTQEDYLSFLAFLGIGTVIELFAISTGLWSYPEFGWLDIPLWYATLWAGVGIIFYRLGIPLSEKVAAQFSNLRSKKG